MAKGSDILTDIEAILTASLAENKKTRCASSSCWRLPHAAASVAEHVTDSLSYEWGGLQVYFGIGGRARADGQQGVVGSLGDDFLLNVEDSLKRLLQNGQPLPGCRECSQVHEDWENAVSTMVSDVYDAVSGQQHYIPFNSTRRNKLICREFTGSNVPQLVRKYRVAMQTVYKVIAASRTASSAKRPLGAGKAVTPSGASG